MEQTAQEKAEQAIAKRGNVEQRALAELKGKLQDKRVMDQIAGVIPAGMAQALTPDRVVRVAMMTVQGSQYLQQCTPISIMGSIIQAAQLGLVPDGLLGHAYLVPRRVKGVLMAQMQIGYRGAIQLVYRTDKIKLRARCVREGDLFEQHEGSEYRLVHVPKINNTGEVVCAYSIASFPDNSRDHRVLGLKEIEKARSSSDSFKRGVGPWVDHPEAMTEKTAIHKLSKQIPISTETQRALLVDEASSAGKAVQVYRESGGVIDVDVQMTDAAPEEVE